MKSYFMDSLKHILKFKYEGRVLLFLYNHEATQVMKLSDSEETSTWAYRSSPSQHACVAALGPNMGSPSRHDITGVVWNGCTKLKPNLTWNNVNIDFLRFSHKHNKATTVRSGVKGFMCSEIRFLPVDIVHERNYAPRTQFHIKKHTGRNRSWDHA
jgi:hypothetical protein